MVELRYVGRIKESDEIFDLTEEEVAKEEGVYNSRMNYGPVYVLLGEGEVIEGLEEALKDMEAGEERELSIDSSKAFGKRESDKIKTMSAKKFRENDVKPTQGSIVEVNGERGRIIYSGSGRVKVDFNSVLAGKDLKYWVKVDKVVEGEEKAEKIIKKDLSPNAEIELEEGIAKIKMDDEELDEETKEKVSDKLKNYVEGVESVEIS